MNIDLTNKSALVCGSSQGIGKACAIELAQLGANVTLFARNQDSLEKILAVLDISKDQQHKILIADFSKPEEVKSVINADVKKNDGYEILINNTGGPAPGLANVADAENFIDAFNLHLVSNHHLVQALLPYMKQQAYGRIINVISTSVKQPLPGLGVSNTIRGAVASWAKTLQNQSTWCNR